MTLKKFYEQKIKNKIQRIEQFQRRMNKNLNRPTLCLMLEKKQSILRVEIIFLKRTIELINEKYNKAA